MVCPLHFGFYFQGLRRWGNGPTLLLAGGLVWIPGTRLATLHSSNPGQVFHKWRCFFLLLVQVNLGPFKPMSTKLQSSIVLAFKFERAREILLPPKFHFKTPHH